MEIRAVIARDGDGWLQVNTHEWISERLGEADTDLSNSLQQWAPTHGRRLYPVSVDAVAAWANEHYAEVTGPGRGDDRPVGFWSGNRDNLLDQDLGIVLLQARGASSRVFDLLAVLDSRAVYVLAPHQDWTQVIDWSRATGECALGHDFTLEGATHLESSDDLGTYELARQCRHDPDDGGYVACPHCDQPITFTT